MEFSEYGNSIVKCFEGKLARLYEDENGELYFDYAGPYHVKNKAVKILNEEHRINILKSVLLDDYKEPAYDEFISYKKEYLEKEIDINLIVDVYEEKIIGVKVLNSQVVCDLRDGSRLLIDDFLKNYIESEKKSLQKKIMYYSQQISEVTKILHYIDN